MDMKTMYPLFAALCLLAGCSALKKSSPQGAAGEEAKETVIVTTAHNDTLSYRAIDLLKTEATAEVSGDSTARPGRRGDDNRHGRRRIPRSVLVGGDQDNHGCLGSAGYTWSRAMKDCVRVFEVGVRADAVGRNFGAVFIVFSPDSAKAELFFADGRKTPLLDRRTLPDGKSVWNAEDDDTYQVSQTKDGWGVSRRGRLRYLQMEKQFDPALGKMVVDTYSGLLPAASGPGIQYTLSIRHQEHSGDGRFRLLMTYIEADNGKDTTFVYKGRRFTQRGTMGDKDATVYQLITDDRKETFLFLRENEDTLLLLNEQYEKPKSRLNYRLKRVK